MGSIIGMLVGKSIFGHVLGEKAARFIAFAGLALAALLVIWGGKCAYDAAVISRHEAKQAAEIAKADRKADNKAADERLNDAARSSSESAEIKEAINEAKANGADPRAAYYACVKLQQAARREHKPPPDC